MSAARRPWLATFADPAVLSDLRAAIHSMMLELDDCDPEHCAHPEQMCWPIEVFQYIERELHVDGQRPVRFEKGHRPRQQFPAGYRSRNLAAAG